MTNLPRSLASDAACAALDAGNLELAVELLEQGRGMVWSMVDAYRFPLGQLHSIEGGEELADMFESLSSKLERLILSSSEELNLATKPSGKIDSFDSKRIEHCILLDKWLGVVGKIREIVNFGDFLQAPLFKTLQLAAAEGPVIMINFNRYCSDAIILLLNHSPVLVPLPGLSVDSEELNITLGHYASHNAFISVLHHTWENIVSPVVDRLSELGIPRSSRIWLCPAAELSCLPLHAAGSYRPGEKSFTDMYTCSYVTTLSSLIRARSSIVQPLTAPKLLIVGRAGGVASGQLPMVKVEVDTIKNLVPGNCTVKVLFGPDANNEEVLEGLKQHSWVHFAFHRHLGGDSWPFMALFELHNDHRLHILDFIQAKLPNAELVFISACFGAVGDSDSHTLDENIHLSAALQFCGFRSAVGTLWQMSDDDGPPTTTAFYKYMFCNPEEIDFRHSAKALKEATKELRKAKVPHSCWVLFIHMGV